MTARPGFTIIEVLVALMLLAVVLVGMQTATGRFVGTVAASDRQATAIQAAEDRIELIRTDPQYDQLENRYEKVETNIPEFPGFTRRTDISTVRDSSSNGVTHYTRVTVTVTGQGLAAPVERTVTIGRP
jgi:prepilin-type N-terminal cleavage/methylation domain-containing protein